jgi:hypothetical protein
MGCFGHRSPGPRRSGRRLVCAFLGGAAVRAVTGGCEVPGFAVDWQVPITRRTGCCPISQPHIAILSAQSGVVGSLVSDANGLDRRDLL